MAGAWRWWKSHVPFVPQMESVECGAASLAMVLAHHGHHAPLAEVRRACRISRDGASAQAICEAARGYGLDAEGVQADIAGIRALPLPAILHWSFSHFVVLERVSRRHVTIVDPSGGRRRVTFAEVGRNFTGVALAMTPGPDFVRRRRSRTSLRRYLGLLRLAAPSLGQVLVASFLLQVIVAVFPAAQQFLVDRVLVTRHEPWLWMLGLALAFTALAQAALGVVRGWVLQGLQIRLDLSLMTSFVRHLLDLPLTFFLRRRTGDLAQRVQDATAIRNLVANRAVSALLDASQLLTVGALMVLYDTRLASIVFALGIAELLLLIAVRRAKRQLMTVEQAAVGRESAALVEAFSTLETTKTAGAEAHVFARWADRAVERVNSNLPRQHLDLALGRSMAFLQTLALALVFWLGGRSVISQEMTLGVFTAFLMLQALFLAPLDSLLTSVDQLQYVGVQLLRVDDVFDTPGEARGTTSPGPLRGEIELTDVSFAYAEGSPLVLQNITFAIRPGQKVAIVGRTGAGKSSLAGLLTGVYRPTDGTISFDGHDLRDLDLTEVRHQIGCVPQDSFLFDDTIRANLSLDRTDVSLAEIEEAARIACIDDEIRAMPDGFDTVVGENGRALSGGQRQRLALARAVVRKPSILLLDEATRSVDHELDRRIDANLSALGCTRIVVSHRFTSVKTADVIVVIDGGRLVQCGRYQDLADAPGLFGELVAATTRHAGVPVRT
jgi:ATP-binding cassette subfamily B protein